MNIRIASLADADLLAEYNRQLIRVEVLTGNTGGKSFWRAVGFSDYCITLEC